MGSLLSTTAAAAAAGPLAASESSDASLPLAEPASAAGGAAGGAAAAAGGGATAASGGGGGILGGLSGLRSGYESVVSAIIRPPRAAYTAAALGPRAFEFRGAAVARLDSFGAVVNARGQRLACSPWVPAGGGGGGGGPRPAVVYLHGNSSSRVGALEALETVLGTGASLFAFDCAGSGLSEGDWVTLGWHERDDVAAVVAYLRADPGVSAVALWGRSMGAATALLHVHRDPSIAGLVLDSCFADLRQLANELVDASKAQVPYHVPASARAVAQRPAQRARRARSRRQRTLPPAFRSLLPAARARAGHCRRRGTAPGAHLCRKAHRHGHFRRLAGEGGHARVCAGGACARQRSVARSARAGMMRCRAPLSPLPPPPPQLIISGERDTFVPPHHARQIYRAYAGDKNLLLLPQGDHNSMRPRSCHDSIAAFLTAALRAPAHLALVDGAAASLRGLQLRGLVPPTAAAAAVEHAGGRAGLALAATPSLDIGPAALSPKVVPMHAFMSSPGSVVRRVSHSAPDGPAAGDNGGTPAAAATASTQSTAAAPRPAAASAPPPPPPMPPAADFGLEFAGLDDLVARNLPSPPVVPPSRAVRGGGTVARG